MGFSPAQQRAPGILIPLWGVEGNVVGHQLRPDNPRFNGKEKPIKYETPQGASNRLDCPPRCRKGLGNPQVRLFITEGVKKADALASAGACAVALAQGKSLGRPKGRKDSRKRVVRRRRVLALSGQGF